MTFLRTQVSALLALGFTGIGLALFVFAVSFLLNGGSWEAWAAIGFVVWCGVAVWLERRLQRK